MENASKALIMAGSMLIALMILGALLLMFSNLSSYQEVHTQSTREAQVIEFNNQFETYNRTDVRGNDLLSLVNRAINYNRTNSYKGTENNDRGQEIGYTPIVINFVISDDDYNKYLTTPDNDHKLITKKSYTIGGTTNTFENDISEEITEIEENYGKENLNQIVIAMSKIFIDNNSTDQEKKEAVNTYNKLSPISQNVSRFTELASKKDKIYKYYEYVQFKRLYFDCKQDNGNSGVTYDKNTGRITEMNFISNGKQE